MTNFVIPLVQEQKSPLGFNVYNDPNLSDEERRRKRTRAITFFILGCLTLQFLLLCAGNANRGFHRHSFNNPLDLSWKAGRKTQQNIHDAILYTPEQLHLSLGMTNKEIYLTWSTMAPVNVTQVLFCEQSNKTNGCKNGYEIRPALMLKQTVQEEDVEWIKITKRHSRVLYTHRAKIGTLKPGRFYIYKAMSGHVSKSGMVEYYSKTYQLHAKDLSDTYAPITLALFGDLGLINGQSVPRLIESIDKGELDLIIHNGDFAYDLNTHHGHYGDEFMRLIEPIAARVPYQTSVGNHEKAQNFTHYDHRFSMVNRGGLTSGELNNFYYSFNVGPVHFVAFSTEFYYFLDSVGLPSLHNQFNWLKEDLKYASSPEQREERPWIIVFGHRPMYCSSRSGDDCAKENNILRKGLPFLGSYALEKLFYDNGVDVELYSHEHQYERFLPIYDYKILNGTDSPDHPYLNPRAPVHIISGSAGCQERLDPFTGKPVTGSVVQIADYGYTKLKASRCKLVFEQISDDKQGDIVDTFTITKISQTFPIRSDNFNKCNKIIDVNRFDALI